MFLFVCEDGYAEWVSQIDIIVHQIVNMLHLVNNYFD